MDLQAKQLEKTLTMQKFDYLPTLSLTGLYQWTAMNNDFKFKDYMWNPYSMVGLSLSIPIFSGGSKFYKIKQTRKFDRTVEPAKRGYTAKPGNWQSSSI